MNLSYLRDNRLFLPVLLSGVLLVILVLVLFTRLFLAPGDAGQAGQNAMQTRTAVALTSQALLGPFPTSTAPTRTPTETPTVTLAATQTLQSTNTATATPFILPTLTARTAASRPTQTNTPRPTSTNPPRPTTTRTAVPPRPTNTSVPPTAEPTQVEPTSYP